MTTEFKKHTDWYYVRGSKRSEVFRLVYGFTCIRGNMGPYFSVTHECYKSKLGELAPSKREVSFGCAGEDIIESLPLTERNEFRKALAFHSFEPRTGPMHYEANALFRLAQAAGEYDENGPSYLRPREGEDPWKAFLSLVAYGFVPGDFGESEKSLRRTLTEISEDGRKLWLRNRLPLLQAAFFSVVHNLNLTNELEQALSFFEVTP